MERANMPMTKEQEKPDQKAVDELVYHGVLRGADYRAVDMERAILTLRSKVAQHIEQARANEAAEVRNKETRRNNRISGTREILSLQNELLAAQERIVELQHEILDSRRQTMKGATPTTKE
jgi:nitric oxide reductase large subunit